MKCSALVSVMSLMVLAAGCLIEPPLHLHQAMKTIIKVIWKAEVYPEGIKPDGVSLYVFRDGYFYMQHTTADVDSCALQLEPGRYRIYMFSQSPEEYGSVEFENLNDFNRACVRVTETKNGWYKSGDDEELITNPEQIVVGVSDEFEVSEEMVEQYRRYAHGVQQINGKITKAGEGDGEGNGEGGDQSEELAKLEEMVSFYTVRVPIYPRSIVSQYWVTIYSENADVLKSVRASTTGMAKSFELTQDVTGPEVGTQFITDWTLTLDDPISRVGHIDGKITTFGFPNGELPSADRDSTLNVSALLIDNKTVESYVFNVGDRITAGDPPDGYRALYRLVFGSVEAPELHPPDVRPADEAAGFDATVDDWEEVVEVDVLM